MSSPINAMMRLDIDTTITGHVQETTGEGVIRFADRNGYPLAIFLGPTPVHIFECIANIRAALGQVECAMIDKTSAEQDLRWN